MNVPLALRRRRLAGLLSTALAGLALSATVQASTWCGQRCDQLVIDWNETAFQTVRAADGHRNPLTASRALAMVHLAMHDAVNSVEPRYTGYADTGRAERGADAAVAAVVAAHDVLLALYPSQKDMLRGALERSLHDAGLGAPVDGGRRIGARAAAAVLARRANDGSAGQEAWRATEGAGRYRHLPGVDFVVMPHWRHVQPFALRSPEQFRVAPPPALDGAEYAQAFREVKETGGQQKGAARTAEQSHYAAFWYEFSEAGWNRVARVVAREHAQDLWERARSFALLNAALADAYIAGWDSKLHHDFWRPVTAIRAAASDGNPATQEDKAWNSFLPTPPIQDHPSTHSALGAAAAAVLAHAFGRDDIAFSFASPSALPAHPVRRFPSFSAAAHENADSRVRAGLHFRFATVQGLKLGEQVGNYAVRNLLTPAP